MFLSTDQFFSQSCAPGSDPGSSLCALCIGNEAGESKCAPNSNERYHGYAGAFRCVPRSDPPAQALGLILWHLFFLMLTRR